MKIEIDKQAAGAWVVSVNGVTTAESFTTKADALAQADYLRGAAVILSAYGRKGGLVSSKAKAKAARANGKKGGRPCKVVVG